MEIQHDTLVERMRTREFNQVVGMTGKLFLDLVLPVAEKAISIENRRRLVDIALRRLAAWLAGDFDLAAKLHAEGESLLSEIIAPDGVA